MRFGLVLVTAGLVCSMSLEAEARARGGFFKGSRGSPSAPAPQPRSGPSMGVGVGVVVPVGPRSVRNSVRTQQPQQRHLLPLPPRPAEDQDGPRIYSASSESAAPAEPKRPWCHDGKVVGRGSGFCEVTLAAERREAPALFALGN